MSFEEAKIQPPRLGHAGAIYDALVNDFPDMLSRTAFVTGDTMGHASLQLLKESELPYLEKPVSPSEFRNLIGTLLANRKETFDG